MITFLVGILALAIGFAVFKLTFKLFSVGIRFVLFGLTTAFIFIPALFGFMIF